MKRYKDYDEIMQYYGNNIVIIHYPFRWGGQFCDKSFWCAIFPATQEVYDYHTKNHLKNDLTNAGLKWLVVRHHLKNKGISIIEKSD